MAVIGYGPTGATAANLLGRLGLKVLVIERDSDIYGRARAISTDEEVLRIWQSVGLADRLQQDMLPDRPLNFVGADGRALHRSEDHSHGWGIRRSSSSISRRLIRCCARACAVPRCRGVVGARMPAGLPQRRRGRAHAGRPAHRRGQALRAFYVIAADGGSSPTRGQLGIGYIWAAPTANDGSSSTPR